MSDYYDISKKEIEGDPDFMDYVDNEDFQADLVRFFSGGRYKYTVDQMKEKGFEGLAKDFVEHMRFQGWNEVTAARDLNYVRNKDMDERGKQAFGRLIKTWDGSSGAGVDFGESVGDFSEAILKAPSTWVGFASFGIGKALAKGGSAVSSLVLRESLDKILKQKVASATAKIASRPALAATTEAGIGVGTGAALSGFQGQKEGKTREELGIGPEYTGRDLAIDAAIGAVTEGALSGAGGYLSGYLGRKRSQTVESVMKERGDAFKQQAAEGLKNAKATFNDPSVTDEQRAEAMKIIADLDDIYAARAGKTDGIGSAFKQAAGLGGRKIKDRLDPARVEHGKALLKAMNNPDSDTVFSYGLSAHTMRGVAAAFIDISKEFNVEGGRVTEAIANRLRDGDETVFDFLDNVRKKYGLSKEEFSNIYLSEVSRAGQTLGFLSGIKRGVSSLGGKATEGGAAPTNLDLLFANGSSSLTGDQAKQITAAAVRNTEGSFAGNLARDLDNLRVSIMTSQPATTVRNVTSTGLLIGADMSDQVFKAIFKGITGDTKAIKDIIPQTTAILRGMTFNKTEAELLRRVILEELPAEAMSLYNNASRIEMGMESNSVIAKVARGVNVANTLTDTALKEAIFYGSLDRQFRDNVAVTKDGITSGTLSDWLKTNKSLEDLPAGVSLEEAIKDANRMTMQDTFKGDTSAVAVTTRALVNTNRKVPFLVSSFLGIPFPRYLGNHVQRLMEYTPVVGEIAHRTNIIKSDGEQILNPLAKESYDATRIARQATGFTMLVAGGYIAENYREGEVDWGSLKDQIGSQQDLKPILGPLMLHAYVGDQVYRAKEGLPTSYGDMEQFTNDMADVLGGIPEFSFDLGIATAPLYGVVFNKDDPQVMDRLYRSVGDFVNTYTMLAAPARDLIGQVDYDQAGSPYTRPLSRQDTIVTGREFVGPGLQEGINRATRSLPDLNFIQYTQSFNGENGIPIYDFDSPVARGKVDPALKQFTGITAEPPMTELRKNMTRFGLKNWQIYGNTRFKNAVIDYHVERNLAKGVIVDGEVKRESINKQFMNWYKNTPIEGLKGEPVWNDIPDDNPIKKKILENWILKKIEAEQKDVQVEFENYLRAGSRSGVRGFVRENYRIQSSTKEGRGKLDDATISLTGGRFQTADDYIGSSESIPDEINRRLALLKQVSAIKPLDLNIIDQ